MCKLPIKEKIELGPLTTLKVGGRADYFVACENEIDLRRALSWANANLKNVFILGGGSNVVISDGGFRGLVIHLRKVSTDRISIRDGLAKVPAGVDWDTFVAFCTARQLAGVECLSGIPGSVGAAPVQNIGAYGQEVSESIKCVEVIDVRDGKPKLFSNTDCKFAYRDSIFKNITPNPYIITSVHFNLRPDGKPVIKYGDLKKEIYDAGLNEFSLIEVRDAVMRVRRRKSMVICTDDPNRRSVGSFFKNPIINESEIEITRVRINANKRSSRELPEFPEKDGVKVPAAWLIEEAGFDRGFTMGEAAISTNHTLALVNRGRAQAQDIISLAERIYSVVWKKFGVQLKAEPDLVGFTTQPLSGFVQFIN